MAMQNPQESAAIGLTGLQAQSFSEEYLARYAPEQLVCVAPPPKPDGMAPINPIPEKGLSGMALAMARIHNRYGLFLWTKTRELGIGVETAAAVLKMETAGEASSTEDNERKPEIRFESHLFYDQYTNKGANKERANIFHRHFRFNAENREDGHFWRCGLGGAWIAYHRSQQNEYEVFKFALSLGDGVAAYYAISEGRDEIREYLAGYTTARKMVTGFAGGSLAQLDGFFTVIAKDPAKINALKKRDLLTFSRLHGNKGSAAAYQVKITAAAAAYEQLGKKFDLTPRGRPAAPPTLPGRHPDSGFPLLPLAMFRFFPLMTLPYLSLLLQKKRLFPNEMALARALIAFLPNEKLREAYFVWLQEKTFYHSQRNNRSGDGRIGDFMCNLTSLAMVLETLGISNPEPARYPQFEDYLEAHRVQKKYGPRTEHAVLQRIAGDLGAEVAEWQTNISHPTAEAAKAWWKARALSHLRAGRAILLGIGNHIVRLQGVHEEGLVADDPFGRSRLKAGAKLGWAGVNKMPEKGRVIGEEEGAAGDDTVWPWSMVAGHTFNFLGAFQTAGGTGGAAAGSYPESRSPATGKTAAPSVPGKIKKTIGTPPKPGPQKPAHLLLFHHLPEQSPGPMSPNLPSGPAPGPSLFHPPKSPAVPGVASLPWPLDSPKPLPARPAETDDKSLLPPHGKKQAKKHAGRHAPSPAAQPVITGPAFPEPKPPESGTTKKVAIPPKTAAVPEHAKFPKIHGKEAGTLKPIKPHGPPASHPVQLMRTGGRLGWATNKMQVDEYYRDYESDTDELTDSDVNRLNRISLLALDRAQLLLPDARVTLNDARVDVELDLSLSNLEAARVWADAIADAIRSHLPAGKTPPGLTAQRSGELPPGAGDVPGETIRRAALEGIHTPAAALPHAAQLRRAFGQHDIDNVTAHAGGQAAASAAAMQARAYTTGSHIVFAGPPDLRTVAHEMTHVMQQRFGLLPAGGIGRSGDIYEQQAEDVAARVAAGESVAEQIWRMTDPPLHPMDSVQMIIVQRAGGKVDPGDPLPGLQELAKGRFASFYEKDPVVMEEINKRSVSDATKNLQDDAFMKDVLKKLKAAQSSQGNAVSTDADLQAAVKAMTPIVQGAKPPVSSVKSACTKAVSGMTQIDVVNFFFYDTQEYSSKQVTDQKAQAFLKGREDVEMPSQQLTGRQKRKFAAALKKMPTVKTLLKARTKKNVLDAATAAWKDSAKLSGNITESQLNSESPPTVGNNTPRDQLDDGTFKKHVDEAEKYIKTFTDADLLKPLPPPKVVAHLKWSSGYGHDDADTFRAYQSGNEVHVAQDDATPVIVHEVGHYLENKLPHELWHDLHLMLRARAAGAGPDAEKAGAGDPGMETEGRYKGTYAATGGYTSSAYGGHGPTEMVSMTVEFLSDPSTVQKMINKDPQQAAIVLRGLKPKEYAETAVLREFDQFLPHKKVNKATQEAFGWRSVIDKLMNIANAGLRRWEFIK